MWVCGSECVLCVGQFCVGMWECVFVVYGTVCCGFVGVSIYCVWDSLVWLCASESFLCVGQFCVGLWE